MKILHISDAHLGRAQYGLPEREEDYYKAFEEALKLGRSADIALVTGDLFDTRRPPNRALMRFVDAVRAFGIPMLAIGGNHDYSYVRHRGEGDLTHTALGLLDKLGLLRLLCFSHMDVGGVAVFGACATPGEFQREYREKLLKAPPGSILAIHQAVEGVKARYPLEEDDFTMPAGVYQGLQFLHIAAGHVHDHAVRHPIGAVWAGSLELWDAGEFETWDYAGRWEKAQDAAAKGVFLIDVAGRAVSPKALPLSPRRPMYRVRLYLREERELMPAAEEAARMFDRGGAVVRVELYGVLGRGVKARAIGAYFSRALYVDVVDRTAGPERAVELRGSAIEELWRVMREKLGNNAGLVLKAMALIREGEREAAYKLILKALYD